MKLDKFAYRMASCVINGVSDLDWAADGTHVLFGPINAKGFVDGGMYVTHAHHSSGHRQSSGE
mgnify:CR=1 FL=1